MKGPNKVLAMRRVDSGFTAHRGIDFRQQRCRHLNKTHPAPDRRRSEPREIANDPAAKRDDNIAALHFRADQGIADAGIFGEGFRPLARCHGDR